MSSSKSRRINEAILWFAGILTGGVMCLFVISQAPDAHAVVTLLIDMPGIAAILLGTTLVLIVISLTLIGMDEGMAEQRRTERVVQDFATDVSDLFGDDEISQQQTRLDRMDTCKHLSARMAKMLTNYLNTASTVLTIEDTGAAMEIDFLIGDDDLMVTTQETAIVPYHRVRDVDYWKQLGKIMINNHRARTAPTPRQSSNRIKRLSRRS